MPVETYPGRQQYKRGGVWKRAGGRTYTWVSGETLTAPILVHGGLNCAPELVSA